MFVGKREEGTKTHSTLQNEERETGGRKGQKEKEENQDREAKVQKIKIKKRDIENYWNINYLEIFSYKQRLA